MRDHPQRLLPPSSPGALFKRATAPLQRRKLREVTERDAVYLGLVRSCPCLKCGMDPCGEASHCRLQSAAHGKRGGIGKKPADKWVLPLCAACHRQDNDALHQVGEALFWHILGLDPLLVAERLYAARGDTVAMRAVVFAAIGSRRI
jgi:hypothetical protein